MNASIYISPSVDNKLPIDDTGKRRGGREGGVNLEVVITERFGPSPSAEVD